MNSKNPYIPNGSTPIKNEIIFDIIAKGLLSYSEIRIAMFIIYKSWRYIDKEHKRRKDWTDSLSVTEISKEIGMNYAEVCRNLKNMIKSHILLAKDENKYQFNEHYEEYDKKSYMTKSHIYMTKSHTDMTKSHIQPLTSSDKNKVPETLNKSLNKYINKKDISKDIVQKDAQKENKRIRKTSSRPYLLAKWFYEFRNVPAEPTAADMRNFKLLLDFYSEEVIKKGILWRLNHDSDGFWINKITSSSVYRNFGNWMAESSNKALSFEEWLSKNPDLDYRKFEDQLARADYFMRAFNEAKKNRLVYFTEKDYEIYRKAVRIKTREIKEEVK